MLNDPPDPRRTEYLERFADREGRQYLWTFYARYGDTDDVWKVYLEEHSPSPTRFARATRCVFEDIEKESFAAIMSKYGFEGADALYEKTDARPFGWHDRGYLAGVHPLELWLLRFRHDNPDAVWNDVVAAGILARQEAYRWLFTANARAGAQQPDRNAHRRRSIRPDPQAVAEARLSVRAPRFVAGYGDREFRRPATGAARVDGDTCAAGFATQPPGSSRCTLPTTHHMRRGSAIGSMHRFAFSQKRWRPLFERYSWK